MPMNQNKLPHTTTNQATACATTKIPDPYPKQPNSPSINTIVSTSEKGASFFIKIFLRDYLQ